VRKGLLTGIEVMDELEVIAATKGRERLIEIELSGEIGRLTAGD